MNDANSKKLKHISEAGKRGAAAGKSMIKSIINVGKKRCS